jgi:hypothetical protein
MSVTFLSARTPDGSKEDVFQLVAQVNGAEAHREAGITQVVSTRRYVLRNKHWEKDAVMYVRFIARSGKDKKFEILRMENAEGLQKRVFVRILEGEVEAVRGNSEEDSEITPANYDFNLIGSESLQGRECLVVGLTPKRSTKYLIVGKAWLDPKEKAILRVEGRTARSISFWIGKPNVQHEFRKVEDLWLSASNRTVSDVKLMGRTELTIEYLDYKVSRTGSADIAQTLVHPTAAGK